MGNCCYAFSREVDVGSDCRTLNTEAVSAYPPRVGATESTFLDGIDLTTNAGPSESGANVASVDDTLKKKCFLASFFLVSRLELVQLCIENAQYKRCKK